MAHVVAKVVLHPVQFGFVALGEELEHSRLRQVSMVHRLVIPAEHVEQKLYFVLIGADLKLENDLFNDFEELVANSTFTAVATA